MRDVRIPRGLLAPLLVGLAYAVFAQSPSSTADADLGGTSWQLVRFQGGDGRTLTPADPSLYTVDFEAGGTLSARIDCNRGHGVWSSAAPNQIQFGPMATTRVMCPPAPLTDKLTADWPFVRSYTLKDGHLFFSLMADGGTYEFAPAGGENSSGIAQPGSSALAGLPATFTGTIPCADCPGIRYQVDLRPDHTFSSSMTYLERNATHTDSGQWELQGTMLILHGSQGSTDKFALRDADTLRKLDMNGQEIVSQLNYDLKREPAQGPGQAAPASSPALEGPRWVLVGLGGMPVGPAAERKAPFMVLDASSHRVSGSSGCNQMMGGYELNGNGLVFTRMAGTMMACPQGMDTERAFLDALGRTATWKITGSTLMLFDAAGRPLATLEAPPGD